VGVVVVGGSLFCLCVVGKFLECRIGWLNAKYKCEMESYAPYICLKHSSKDSNTTNQLRFDSVFGCFVRDARLNKI
jgi:hypothetical protein